MLTKDFASTVDVFFNLLMSEDDREFGCLKAYIIVTKEFLKYQKEFFVIYNLLIDYNIKL